MLLCEKIHKIMILIKMLTVFGPLVAFEPDNPELLFCCIYSKLVIFTSLMPKKMPAVFADLDIVRSKQC